MSIKIMGTNFDDLAKLMGADLIIAGTALVGEVKTASTFYAGSSALLTGSGTQTLNAANENVAAGYYAATTLSAVDGDLAVGNIKDGVTIFGFLGTFDPALAEDELGEGISVHQTDADDAPGHHIVVVVNSETEVVMATCTPTFTAGCLAVAVSMGYWQAIGSNSMRQRLYMGGVLVATGIITDNAMDILVATRALTGAQVCKAVLYNTHGVDNTDNYIWGPDANGKDVMFGIGVGSVKTV